MVITFNERFVIAWQQSGSVGEVYKKLRYTGDISSLRSKANHFRNQGVRLKRFHAGGRPAGYKIIDYDSLSKLADKYMPEPEGVGA